MAHTDVTRRASGLHQIPALDSLLRRSTLVHGSVVRVFMRVKIRGAYWATTALYVNKMCHDTSLLSSVAPSCHHGCLQLAFPLLSHHEYKTSWSEMAPDISTRPSTPSYSAPTCQRYFSARGTFDLFHVLFRGELPAPETCIYPFKMSRHSASTAGCCIAEEYNFARFVSSCRRETSSTIDAHALAAQSKRMAIARGGTKQELRYCLLSLQASRCWRYRV